MSHGSRRFIAAALIAFGSAALAQAPEAFPRRPITIVVPYSPGGAADATARALGEAMAKDFKQPVVIDNRPGAAGLVGAAAVAKSKPDGYTLLFTNDAIQSTAAHITRDMPLDPLKDLAAVSMVATSPLVIAGAADLPVHDIPELIAYAKQNPGKLSFGTSGNGTPHHIAGAMLASMTGIELLHVPYKGTSAAMQDLLGGQIRLVIGAMSALDTFAKAGRIRLLGVTSSKPSPAAPGIAPIADTVKGYEVEFVLGVVAPRETPPVVIATLSEAINRAIKSPEVVARLEQQGLTPFGGTPADMDRRMRADYDKRGAIIKAIGLKPE